MTMPDDEKPATRGDLRAMREVMATKGDLRKLQEATKGDLRAMREVMATKADLRKLQEATKGDLKRETDSIRAEMATKADISRLSVEVAKMSARMGQMKEDILSEFRRHRDDLARSYEESVTKGQMYFEKALTHGDIISSHEQRLTDHERRIRAMESPPPL